MTTFNNVLIDGVERRDDALRLEINRTVNGIGTWQLLLRDTAGKYKGLFDVQDSFTVQIADPTVRAILGGRVDGPAVTLRARDLESYWDEYVILRGVDGNQDLLFHNDFDHDYPNSLQQLKAVMDDVFNTQLAGLTNISYTPPVGATPVVGAVEFREGASFLTQLQELHKRAGYVFYTDDGLVFRSGAPGFSAMGLTFYSSAGVSNIIDLVDYQERDGDKHYNYVKLYGKNPMYDGWTELNATNVATTGWYAPITSDPLQNITANVKVGYYSQVATNKNPVFMNLIHTLTAPVFNYNFWDFSNGEVGIWAQYDNIAAAPGTPGVGTCFTDEMVECRITDFGGNILEYHGESSKLYEDDWGYCTFPIGEKCDFSGAYIADQWCVLAGTSFDWSHVVELSFICADGSAARYPSHFYIDGISLPIPCKTIIQNAGAQATYRRRPYVDTWAHIRTQNALNNAAATLLPQVQSTAISNIKFTVAGDYRIRYAGQSFDLDIPSLGLNTEVFYATSLHHIIEPHSDVSSGYGFDWITEIEACPVSGVTYDMSRLRTGSLYSASQMAMRGGTGLRAK